MYHNQHIIRRLGGLLAIAIGLASCSSGQNDRLFDDLPASETGIDFINRSLDKKNFNIFNYRNFYNGGGVAIGDLNNDGLPEVFLTSNFEANKLYVNRTKAGGTEGIHFEDMTQAAGIFEKKFWSTGVTFADVNGDGWLDIYVCNSGSRDARGNQLYINNGGRPGAVPTFVERAADYGLVDGGFSTHAAFLDYDRDGDLDMYLLNNSFTPMDRLQFANVRDQRDKLGGHKLFRNDLNSATPALSHTGGAKAGKFVDVSAEAGIYGSLIGFGLGITIGDVNNDNWLDIFISNDFYERDYLYINQQNGTFRESIKEYMQHTSLASMGADIADVNNDGNLDIFVTDMMPEDDYRLKTTSSFDGYDLNQLKLQRDFYYQDSRNMLHLNNGIGPDGRNGTFSEVGRMAGAYATDWSWGALLFDMDMDGKKDIFVANGILKDLTDQDYVAFLADNPDLQSMIEGTKKFDYKEYVNKMGSSPLANYAFRGAGNGMQFTNEAERWGLAKPGFSNGSAYGDLDADGDLDLIVNNNDAPASVYRNRAVDKNKQQFLRVNLVGAAANRHAIGATVRVYQHDSLGPQLQVLQQMPNRGFESSVDLTLVFGLAKNPVIDSLVVIWPDDAMQRIRNPKANQTLTLTRTDARDRWTPSMTNQNSKAGTSAAAVDKQIFADITARSGLSYTHVENGFVDYNRDVLLKQMLSREGPALAVGDINGDGLDDVFLGGAVDMRRGLYVQRPDGTLALLPQPLLTDAIYTEDVAAAFFDADNDKDLDLYIASGGNEFSDPTLLYDRFYRNDGRGIFTWDRTFPRLLESGSCVRAADYDQDGDLDLFVGARLVPGQYGKNPTQTIFQNDGPRKPGTFRNVTAQLLPAAADIGLVKDGVWADVDKDTWPDLILVGDWMSVTILHNRQGRGFEREELPNTGGWWNAIHAADLDGDGDIDFVAGNQGLNSRLTASPTEPAHLYANDFDRNGTFDPIMTCFRPTPAGRQACVLMQKPDLQKQIPSIKTKFLKHTDYAKARFEDLFTAQQREGMVTKTVQLAQTTVFLNNGKGQFTAKPLPMEAQTAPIWGIISDDFNRDGKLDLLLAGNFFDVLSEMGRYDANYGLLLLGNGRGQFIPRPVGQDGFFTKGQVRRMQVLRGPKGRKQIVLAKNNDAAQVFGY